MPRFCKGITIVYVIAGYCITIGLGFQIHPILHDNYGFLA